MHNVSNTYEHMSIQFLLCLHTPEQKDESTNLFSFWEKPIYNPDDPILLIPFLYCTSAIAGHTAVQILTCNTSDTYALQDVLLSEHTQVHTSLR